MTDGISVRDLRGFIFDMDGVIYRGNQVLPGAVVLLENLRRANVPVLFLTNNSTRPPQEVVAGLADMGIQANVAEILTSAMATAAVLAKEMPGRRVLVIGEAGLSAALMEAGFSLTEAHRQAEVVVVGMDRACTYAKLREAALAVHRGAPFIATNPDRTLPTEQGLTPGTGALVGAVELTTNVKARVIGKPEPSIFWQALARLGTPAEFTAAIGDRPETDIVGGQRAGLRTIAVLTGVGSVEAFATMQPPPDWVFEDLVELNRAYFDLR